MIMEMKFDSMCIKITGEIWSYVDGLDPMIETHVCEGTCWTYDQLMNNLKDGYLKDEIEKIFKNMKKISGEMV